MKILIATLLAYFLATQAMAAELTSSVNRVQLALNETLNLTLEYNQQVDTRELDLSALNQDFEILNSSTQSQVSIINGKQDVSTRWTLVLLPKRSGNLVVPSFQINGNFSDAISLQVSAASAAGARSQPLSVEMSLDSSSGYAQEERILTLKLVASPQVSNLSGDTLVVEGADSQLISQERYAEMVDGVNWQVIQWRYALFFDEPGDYEIPAQVFSGLVNTNRSVFDPFGSNGQRMVARAPELSLRVEPAPAEGAWFAAKDVQIQADWPNGRTEARVGEPLTRTLTVMAFGQRPQAIPPLPTADSDSFRQYADQPELLNETSSQSLVGVRRETAALVPTRAGELQLPEIRLDWWDTDEQTWKVAVLPAETISVLPANLTDSLAPPAQSAGAGTSGANMGTGQQPYFWYSLTTGLALICLLLAVEVVRLRQRGVIESVAGKTSQDNLETVREAAVWRELQKSLRSTDAARIQHNLKKWVANLWPDAKKAPMQLLAEHLNEPACDEIRQIDACLYGVTPGPMKEPPAALSASLQTLRQEQLSGRRAKAGGLRPLYPPSRA